MDVNCDDSIIIQSKNITIIMQNVVIEQGVYTYKFKHRGHQMIQDFRTFKEYFSWNTDIFPKSANQFSRRLFA